MCCLVDLPSFDEDGLLEDDLEDDGAGDDVGDEPAREEDGLDEDGLDDEAASTFVFDWNEIVSTNNKTTNTTTLINFICDLNTIIVFTGILETGVSVQYLSCVMQVYIERTVG